MAFIVTILLLRNLSLWRTPYFDDSYTAGKLGESILEFRSIEFGGGWVSDEASYLFATSLDSIFTAFAIENDGFLLRDRDGAK